jgi:hypothetical protein
MLTGALYKIEAHIRATELLGEAKEQQRPKQRLTNAKPIVDGFFAWVNKLFEAQGFPPSSPLTKALAYARGRREGPRFT